MCFCVTYESPIGPLLLVSKEDKLIGLWMYNQKYFCPLDKQPVEDSKNIVLQQAVNWLDRYFCGEKPDIKELPLAPMGSSFRKEVWDILCSIPYGEVMTYGQIADIIAINTFLFNISPLFSTLNFNTESNILSTQNCHCRAEC